MKKLFLIFSFIFMHHSAALGIEYVYLFDRRPFKVTGNEVVILEGILQVCEFFGSPGFGEDPSTDHIERGLYLQVPVYGNGLIVGNTAFGPLIQLVLPSSKDYGKMDSLTGKRVRIRGTLFEGHTGHHHTPYLLQIESVEQISKYGVWENAAVQRP